MPAAVAFAGLLGLAVHASANPFGGILFRGGTPVDTFPGESCTQCHRGGTSNPSTAMLDVLVDGSPVSEYAYTPGETVSLTIDFTDTGANRLGFLVTARSGEPVSTETEVRCGSGGTMAPGTSEAGATVKVRKAADYFGQRQRPEPCGDLLNDVWWATQNRPTTGTTATWEVAWTLPVEDVGPLTVSVVANGGNGDGGTSGDDISSKVLTIQPASAMEPPEITGGGDVLAGLAEEGVTAIGAPGAIASVIGSNFVGSGTTASSTLDDSGNLATMVDGVCVEIGAMHRAPLLQVSREVVTFQIPSDVGLGASSVKVIRGCDTDDAVASEAVAFQIATVQPAFFLFSDDTAGISAVRPNMDLVAPGGSVEGRRTRPAIPGDFVTLFGTGFGAVEPAYDAGEIASELRPLETTDLRVMLGELELDAANIHYAGAAPNFAGLEQLVVEIPENAATGSHSFSVLLSGVGSLAGPKLEVATAESLLPSDSCSTGLVLNAGDDCLAAFGDTSGILEVHANGTACVVGSTDNLDMWECDAETLDLTKYDAAIGKNEDGTWTITMLPGTSESMEEETPACTVGRVVNPGESCSAMIAGIAGVFAVDEEGNGCVTAGILEFCGEEINTRLGPLNAEVEMNDDGSWTVTKLP